MSRQRRLSRGQRLASMVGSVLILVGLGFLGYVGWQYYGTDIVSRHKQADVRAQLTVNWANGIDGGAIGLLHVPRFGKDYAMPILPGYDDATLAKGVGWYEKGARPGEVGNFALAAHRVTHGEPFRDFPKLRKGDRVEIETRTHLYTYVLRDNGTDRTVDFATDWVLMSNPIARNFIPSKPILTMLTCSELFHTRNRSVVFGDLVGTIRKTGATTGEAAAASS